MPQMVPSAISYSVGVPEEMAFAAQYPARTCPCVVCLFPRVAFRRAQAQSQSSMVELGYGDPN